MTTLEQNLVFVKGLVQLMDKEAKNAREIEQRVLGVMPEYWTPMEGHKYSVRITIAKWKDFLWICESGALLDSSQDARDTWHRLELVVRGDLKQFGYTF